MKKMLIAISLLLATTHVFAAERNYSYSQEIDYSIKTILESDVKAFKADKNTNCYAYTQCSNGRLIQCQTYGQGCTFYAQFASYVQCTGYNAYGQWINAYATCY